MDDLARANSIVGDGSESPFGKFNADGEPLNINTSASLGPIKETTGEDGNEETKDENASVVDVEGREGLGSRENELNEDLKHPPVVTILDSTGKESDIEQMKSAEFGREKTPDFDKGSNASDQDMKK